MATYMTVYELSREQLIELKQNYMFLLANEGMFGEVVFNDPKWDEPDYDDLVRADLLIPDNVIFEHYAGTIFSEDDFSCGKED